MTRRFFLASAAALAQARQEPEFPNWPQAHIDKLLTDSPWAKPYTAGYTIGRAVQTELNLTTRFSSALPIRQALALAESTPEEAEAAVGPAPERYIVEVGGFLVTAVKQGSKKLEGDFARSARLAVKGRKPLAPIEVVVPEHGMYLSAKLEFARYDSLSPEEGMIEFTAQSGPFVIKQSFPLRRMVYRGALEL